jgi:hypothetical protein
MTQQQKERAGYRDLPLALSCSKIVVRYQRKKKDQGKYFHEILESNNIS